MKANTAGRLRARVRGVGRRANRVATRWRRRLPAPRPASSSHPLIGMVEAFEGKQIVGWVAGEAAELPARVTLHINDLEIGSTWADHPSKHNSWADVRGFRFALADMWKYCKRSDQITVRLNGVPLPIAGKGTYKRPGNDGAESLSELRRLLAGKYLFNRDGKLQLAKQYDTEWQDAILGLYARVGAVIKDRFGYDLFAIYGTLLGFVRDGGFIGYDNDVDVAYVSRHTDPRLAADELRDIAFALIEAGFDVVCRTTAVHVHDEGDWNTRIDIFHLFFNQDGVLTFPFGTSTHDEIKKSQWTGLTDIQVAGRPVKIPAIAETVAACLYGPNWRIPMPGFQWARARTAWGDGHLPESYCEEVYWANFYAHHELPAGSTFFEFVSARDDVPRNVLDIGCGDGRDTFAFARLGWRARGLDRSQVGVDHATKRAVDAELTDVLSFVAGDVADASTVRSIVKQARDAADGGPLLFYMRFFLHSITEETQETLMATLGEVAQPGDALAAEFRTEKDAKNRKVYGGHYRRYQDGFAFGQALRTRFGFEVVHEEEGTGLAPYQDEDPVLYRVVARAASPAANG